MDYNRSGYIENAADKIKSILFKMEYTGPKYTDSEK